MELSGDRKENIILLSEGGHHAALFFIPVKIKGNYDSLRLFFKTWLNSFYVSVIL
jgi:hypothetical protein